MVRVTYTIRSDIASAFSQWTAVNGHRPRHMIEAGMWLLLNLAPADRDALMLALSRRQTVSIHLEVQPATSPPA